MRQVVFAELRHNGRRAVGAALAIGIAVGFVVVVLGATATMQDYLRRNAAGPQLAADAVVDLPATENAPQTLTDADLAQAARTPGVATVYATRNGYLEVAFPDGTAGSLVVVAPPAALRWYTLESGREPAAPGEVLTDAATARSAKLGLGSTLSASLPATAPASVPATAPASPPASAPTNAPATAPASAPATAPATSGQGRAIASAGITLRVVGIVPTVALPLGRSFIAREADVLAWGSAGSPPPIAQLLAVATPAVSADQVRRNLATALPRLSVVDPLVAADQQAGHAATVLTILLLAFTAVALGVAVIVIANTFAIVLAQRSAQLALVRCVGGTRRQVYRAVLVEAAVVGLVASLVGAAGGALLLVGAVAGVSAAFVEADGMTAVIPWRGLAIAVVVGLAVTVVAAQLPARRATRVAPLAALRPDPPEQARRSSRLRIGAGFGCLVLGGVVLALLTATVAPKTTAEQAQLRVLAGMVAGFVAVLGVLFAGPVLVPGVARLVGRPLGVFGPVGRLAVASTLRNPVRASATSTALFVGVCLITLMSVGAATVTVAANSKLAQRFPVDVSVVGPAQQAYRSTDGDLHEVAGGVALPPAAVAAIAGLSGTRATVALRSAVVDLDGRPATVFTADPAAIAAVLRAPLDLRPGTLLVPAERSLADPSQAPQPVALHGSGGSRTLGARSVPVPVPLVAPADFDALVAPGNRVEAGALLARVIDEVDSGAYLAALHSALDDAGTASGGEGAVYEGKVAVGGSLPERAGWEQAMSILLWIATGLLGVAVVISLVGIGNTMALSVLERRREIGVQRAVGLTRRQLRASLTLEAVLLAGVGAVLGVVLGIGFGFAGARLLMAGTATVDAVSVPLDRVAWVVGVALVAAVVASVLPGRRAGRVSPTEALAAT